MAKLLRRAQAGTLESSDVFVALEPGEQGLEIELVCFQGEKLPKLPTAAKLVVRPWDPQNDAPYSLAHAVKMIGM